MVCDTPPSQDASTHKIWNSYLKEYRRYGPDTKAGRTDGLTDRRTDGRTDGWTVRLLYASQSSFGGIKTTTKNKTKKTTAKNNNNTHTSLVQYTLKRSNKRPPTHFLRLFRKQTSLLQNFNLIKKFKAFSRL